MAVRRLINIIEGLAAKRNAQSVRNDRLTGTQTGAGTQTFLVRARVESAGQSSVTISTPEGATSAALATDEPLVAGQNVWAVKTDDGSWLVLGSIA